MYFENIIQRLRCLLGEGKILLNKLDLNFFLISESLLLTLVSNKSENSYRSDHSPVVLTCKTNQFIEGEGFWKFNTSLLLDKDYIELTKQVIKNVKKQYACLVYNTENLCNVDTNMIQFIINNQTFLDILLAEILKKLFTPFLGNLFLIPLNSSTLETQ